MDDFIAGIYKQEVSQQCTFAMMAISDMEKALDSRPDTRRVFCSIQAFLAAAANISRLFWPGRGASQQRLKRGRELRSIFGVIDTSPLASRELRNHFEHFDERLDEWAASSARHIYVDMSIFSPGAIGGVDPEDMIRNFDPVTWTVSFRGTDYGLRPLIEEIVKLSEATKNG